MRLNISTMMAAVAALLLASCTAEEKFISTVDSAPAVTVYTYDPGAEYNVDNDIRVRIVPNSQVSEVYYLAQPAKEVESYKAANGKEAYNEYVIKNGTKMDVGSGYADFVLTDLYGLYDITAVAVGNGKNASGNAEFFGLSWETVTNGTYYFSVLAKMGLESTSTALQVCTTDETLYRFENLFGEGRSMKINLLPDYQSEDEDGVYTYFRVPSMGTGLMYGDYGEISVRDIGYWQNDDAFVTDHGFESGMYEDGYCFVYVQYYVSAGNLGYNYDFFVPGN